MRKVIQIITVGLMTVAGGCSHTGSTNKCNDNICFGLDWQTATEEDVRGWLKSTGDVNAKDKYDYTPLHQAAWHNENPAIITALIEAGADVHAKDQFGRTPLYRAAIHNENPAIAIALIEAGADVHAKDEDGSTPLSIAENSNRDFPFVAAFLTDLQDSEMQLYYEAANSESTNIIDKLLKAGADVNTKTGSGGTPLHYAAKYNNNRIMITTLIEAGADVNARNERGFTPLHQAAIRNENPAIIEALIEAGADVKAKDKNGVTSLHSAATNNENPAIIKALAEGGGNLNARDKYDSMPLHYAAGGNENPATIKALIDAGADLEAKNSNGSTPLHWATRNENPAIIKALVKAGADVNARDKWGDTPFSDDDDYGGEDDGSDTFSTLLGLAAEGAAIYLETQEETDQIVADIRARHAAEQAEIERQRAEQRAENERQRAEQQAQADRRQERIQEEQRAKDERRREQERLAEEHRKAEEKRQEEQAVFDSVQPASKCLDLKTFVRFSPAGYWYVGREKTNKCSSHIMVGISFWTHKEKGKDSYIDVCRNTSFPMKPHANEKAGFFNMHPYAEGKLYGFKNSKKKPPKKYTRSLSVAYTYDPPDYGKSFSLARETAETLLDCPN